MQSGNAMTLDELRDRAEMIRAATVDYMADTRAVHFGTTEGAKNLSLTATVHGTPDPFYVTDHAMQQVCSKAEPSMPIKFLRDLLKGGHGPAAYGMLNYLGTATASKRLVRGILPHGDLPNQPIMRAWLSDSYKRLENVDLVEQALVPVLTGRPDLRIETGNLTYDRMQIVVITREMRAAISVGDEVCAGVRIENSETGVSALTATPFVLRLVCENGLRRPDGALRTVHLGARARAEESVAHLYTDETNRRESELTFLKFRDVIRHALSQKGFDEVVARMRQAAGTPYEADTSNAVDALAEMFALTDAERMLVLGTAISEPKTKWGLVNAVTAAANTHGDFERADELQLVGGKVLELEGSAWRTITEAQAKYTRTIRFN